MSEADRPTSTPPQAKTIAALGSVGTALLGGMLEVVLGAGALFELDRGRIDFSQFMMILGVLSIGPAAGRILKGRGLPATTTAVLGASAAKALGAAGVMRHLVLLPLVLATALPLQACSLFGPGGVDWPDVVQCTPGADDAIVDVSTILLQGEGLKISDQQVKQLEDLALKWGAGTIACLVQTMADRWSPLSGATQSPERVEARARALDFLQRQGVTVQQ